MGISAFDLIVAPVLMATFGAMVAGGAFVGLMNAAEILVGRLGNMVRMARPRPAVRRVGRNSPKPARPRVAVRPRLVG